MAKQPTELEKRYEKELKRIKSAIKREEKKGTIVSDRIIPQKPKVITEASIRRLQKITPETIRKKSNAREKVTKPKEQIIAEESVNDKVVLPKVRKPKEKTKEEKEKIVEAFYDELDREKGDGEPPSEEYELISNVSDLLDGKYTDRQEPEEALETTELTTGYQTFSPYLEKEKENVTSRLETSKYSFDTYYYDTGELESEISGSQTRLDNWQPSTQWSGSLQKIKEDDVKKAKAIIISAVNEYGRVEVARNLYDHAAEVDELLTEIMYRGSGNDFIAGRDAVSHDLNRLQEIIVGHMLSPEESRTLADWMESKEYEDVLE